ncbi:hypothetical protein ACC704_15410, partial [Rhizobium johnstonii]|uniref:hypothetical protein n=1 Tax=Rhizobium johnstonii TaxID=3019933 RepID=UPI003F9882F4
ARKIAAVTFEIGKNAVTALGVKPVQRAFKIRFEIHHMLQYHATVLADRTFARQPLPLALTSTAAKGAEF